METISVDNEEQICVLLLLHKAAHLCVQALRNAEKIPLRNSVATLLTL